MKHRDLCQCATCRTTNPHNHPQGASGYWNMNPTREQKRDLVLNLTVRPKWRLSDCIKLETK